MSLQTPELFDKAAHLLQKSARPEPSRAALKTLLDLYLGNDSRHLNYYGPPGTLRTISFHKLLDDAVSPEELNLKDKAVFIGLSQRLRLDQEDGYYTVFSQPDGSDISGVEIAATAFSNLLDGSWLKPLPQPGGDGLTAPLGSDPCLGCLLFAVIGFHTNDRDRLCRLSLSRF